MTRKGRCQLTATIGVLLLCIGVEAQALGTPPAEDLQAFLVLDDNANTDIAGRLLDLLDHRGNQDNLAWSIEAAKVATRHQAVNHGLSWSAPVPLTGFTEPSKAVLALLERQHMEITATRRDAAVALDSLPEPLRASLARLVDAFLAFDLAARPSDARLEIPAMFRMSSALWPQDFLVANGSIGVMFGDSIASGALLGLEANLSRVLATRNQFLDEVLSMRAAAEAVDKRKVRASSALIDLCPAIALDLVGEDSTYRINCALVFDIYGSDRYYNNAGGGHGGNHLASCTPTCEVPCKDVEIAVAALVDLGPGTDAYGNPEALRGCGVNGGAFEGAGLLIDGGGSDSYSAKDRGTNGGAGLGTAFLLDAGGDDVYTATDFTANGGGLLGLGLLLDGGGNDTYLSGGVATNGGGDFGSGFLFDVCGDERFTGSSSGTNGGGNEHGSGFLLDGGGNDVYIGGSLGANGGSFGGSVGFLLDANGNDGYFDTNVPSGTGSDRTVFPKGLIGAQIDGDASPPETATGC